MFGLLSKLGFQKETFRKDLISDVLAGLTTAFAAIAVGAAFGAESGRGAFAGMVAAAIIPLIASTFGGVRIQASGPTAPMSAVTALVSAFAYEQYAQNTDKAEELVTLTIMLSSLILMVGGLLKLGRFIQLIPQVVIIGFMNGIAILIWQSQIVKITPLGEAGETLTGPAWQNTSLAIFTFFLIFFLPTLLKFIKVPAYIKQFIPASLTAIIVSTIIFLILGFEVETVEVNSTISSASELLSLPQEYFPTSINWHIFQQILPFSLQLALLAYLDSLLTALVMEKVTNEKAKKNQELMAQGLANTGSALFGGIPGAQATIRSIMLVKEGAKTRLAGILVGVFAFIGIFVFKDLISLVAGAIFTGVMIKIGLDVFEQNYFLWFWNKRGWQKRRLLIQLFFILYTTVVTVVVDLTIAALSAAAAFLMLQKFFPWITDASDEEETFSEDEL